MLFTEKHRQNAWLAAQGLSIAVYVTGVCYAVSGHPQSIGPVSMIPGSAIELAV